jgi:predicted CopG family antitoxin
MPYRRVVKVSERVYKALEELKAQLGVDSVNKALEELLVVRSERALKLLGVTPSADLGVTPSSIESAVEKEAPLKVKVEMLSHPWGFWRVYAGEGRDAVVFALPRLVLEGMCGKGLLHPDICRELYEAFRRAEAG